MSWSLIQRMNNHQCNQVLQGFASQLSLYYSIEMFKGKPILTANHMQTKQALQMRPTNRDESKQTGFHSPVQYTDSFKNTVRAQTAIKGKTPSAEVKRGLKSSE